MNIRFVTKTVHSYLDYPVAFSLIATPFILGLGKLQPLALWLSVATGIAALLLTVLTNHKTGLVKVIPYWFHVLIDRLVGLTFLAAPFVVGFSGLDALYYWANGFAVLLVTFVFNANESEAKAAMAA
jgi:hypothetical protein